MRYLLPYEETTETEIGFPGRVFRRRSLNNSYKFFSSCVWETYNKEGWRYSAIYYRCVATKEAAMKALDKDLIDEGYILIPEDQVERFKEKLILLI